MPQDAIQALDVALKQSVLMNRTAIVLSRAVFFPDTSTTAPLPGGAEVSGGSCTTPCQCPGALPLLTRLHKTDMADSVESSCQLESCRRRIPAYSNLLRSSSSTPMIPCLQVISSQVHLLLQAWACC